MRCGRGTVGGAEGIREMLLWRVDGYSEVDG